MGELIDIAMTREEALKIVSNIYQTDKEKEALGVLIPELADSEDERIRKELVNFFQSPFIKENLTDEKIAPWLAYIEKLKERKPVNADYVNGIRKELLGIEDNAKNIDGLTESQWVAIRAAHRLLGEYAEQEQKPASISCGHENDTEWSEEDEEDMKDLRNLVVAELGKYSADHYCMSPWALDSTGVSYPFHFAKLGAKWQKEQKPCKDSGTEGDIMQYIEEGEKRGVKEVISFPEKYGLQKKQKPVLAHDENGDAILSDFEAALFSAFSDAWQTYLNGENVNVVEWAKEHAPELIRVAGKSAEWSEEDKQWLSEVYSAIDHSMYSEVERQAMKKYIDHLRYQSQPKQELDEESSKVVLKAVELLNSYGNSLYNGSFEKESNAVYKVADSLKLLSTQPKPEWSENERQRLKTIAGYLRYKGYEEDAYFIESIPPQQKEEGIKGAKGHPDPAGVWKPSDGQLKALKYFLAHHRLQRDTAVTKWEEYDDLQSLYDILCTIAKS